jgi:pullulanase/glycogen debranching enzyme
MSLCLFDDQNNPIAELKMVRTDNIWHVEAKGCPHKGILYGVRVTGSGGWETGHRWDSEKILLDPYTPLVSGRRFFGVRDEVEQFKEMVRTSLSHVESIDQQKVHCYLQ